MINNSKIGIVDFRNISKDLGFDFQNSDNQCKVQSVNLIDPPSEIELLGSQNLRFKNARNLNFLKEPNYKYIKNNINNLLLVSTMIS